MKIEITEEAVLLTELNDEDRQMLEGILRGAAGKSLVIPRKPALGYSLTSEEELDALISSLRTSAQETLAALHRRGFRIART